MLGISSVAEAFYGIWVFGKAAARVHVNSESNLKETVYELTTKEETEREEEMDTLAFSSTEMISIAYPIRLSSIAPSLPPYPPSLISMSTTPPCFRASFRSLQ